jgi:DNA-binding CsgD family transcriptional regulator
LKKGFIVSTTLLDRIYEAAFVPDQWSDALQHVATAHGCATGAIGAWNDSGAPIGQRATALLAPLVDATMRSNDNVSALRFNALHSVKEPRFTRVESLLSEHELAIDPIQLGLRSIGLESQAATAIAMPSGDLVCISFERFTKDGAFDKPLLDALNTLRPHLARAGMMAARLGLERAQATTKAMNTLGLPAAVMSLSGRVLATNAWFEDLSTTFLPSSRGGLAISDVDANRLFQEMVSASASQVEPAVRSIPIAKKDSNDALVIHLLPLRRAAHEIFSGGDLLIIATAARTNSQIPTPAILMGLFDLTPAEVKLATALAAGRSLHEAAVEANVTRSTSRTYLDRIFKKTGTHQQSQLVALLKSTQPITSS